MFKMSVVGVTIAATTKIASMEYRSRRPPSQTWRTFMKNHAKQLVSIDFFTVPTIRFQILYVFLVLAHDRRRIVHFNVTAHPTAEWTGQQLREAFPLINSRATCSATAMRSSATHSEDKCEIWASTKSCRHRAPLGREPTSSG
jgi:hypothetical protein